MSEIILGKDALKDAEWLAEVQEKAWAHEGVLVDVRVVPSCAGSQEEYLQAGTVLGPAVAALAPSLGLKRRGGKFDVGVIDGAMHSIDATGVVGRWQWHPRYSKCVEIGGLAGAILSLCAVIIWVPLFLAGTTLFGAATIGPGVIVRLGRELGWSRVGTQTLGIGASVATFVGGVVAMGAARTGALAPLVASGAILTTLLGMDIASRVAKARGYLSWQPVLTLEVVDTLKGHLARAMSLGIPKFLVPHQRRSGLITYKLAAK